MPTGELVFPNETQAIDDSGKVRRAAEARLESVKVHVLNLDFMMMLVLAISIDALDIINLTGVGKILTILIDIVIFFVMFLWTYWRQQQMEDAKEEARQMLEAYTKRAPGRRRARAARMIGLSARRGGLIGRAVVKALTRAGLVAIAEIVPILGLIPWWTILVLLALREKVNISNE